MVAWLSSVVSGCWVKSRTSATLPLVGIIKVGHSRGLPVTNRRKWDDVKSHALMSWATHVLQWLLQREAKPQGGAIPKQSQFGLWLKSPHERSELLVMAGQHTCVNTFPGPCTHRPSHHESCNTRESIA